MSDGVVQCRALLDDALARGVEPTIVHAAGSTIIIIAASTAKDPAELVPIAIAAREAKCSVRTMTDDCRRGELAMFGKQRSRTVRRADLVAWIETRRVRPVEGADDLDMRRRMQRLEESRALRIV